MEDSAIECGGGWPKRKKELWPDLRTYPPIHVTGHGNTFSGSVSGRKAGRIQNEAVVPKAQSKKQARVFLRKPISHKQPGVLIGNDGIGTAGLRISGVVDEPHNV